MKSLNYNQGNTLIELARASISHRLGLDTVLSNTESSDTGGEAWLDHPAATFVTLKKGDALRGCIGSLQAYRSLRDDVQSNAISAAFHDPRFPPLGRDEFAEIRIEVSVLTKPEKIDFVDEDDALSQLNPGIDGIIFESGTYKSTFLPQVWEQLPTPELFISHLKQKAGLPPGFWSNDVLLYRYRVEKFSE